MARRSIILIGQSNFSVAWRSENGGNDLTCHRAAPLRQSGPSLFERAPATTLLGCGWGGVYAKLKGPAKRTSQKTPSDR